jgi:hypothetical protein
MIFFSDMQPLPSMSAPPPPPPSGHGPPNSHPWMQQTQGIYTADYYTYCTVFTNPVCTVVPLL